MNACLLHINAQHEIKQRFLSITCDLVSREHDSFISLASTLLYLKNHKSKSYLRFKEALYVEALIKEKYFYINSKY